MSTNEFMKRFSEELSTEFDHFNDLAVSDPIYKRMSQWHVGSWILVRKHQAIWRTHSEVQWDGHVPDEHWGKGRIQRPAEVVFLAGKDKDTPAKVIIDCGVHEVQENFIMMMKRWTMPDDQDLMPLYDLEKISK